MEQTAIPNLAGEPEPGSGDTGDYTVLIVDDDDDILTVMEATLETRYAVLKAHSAREGLALLRTRPVHLLITDQYMPGMTGVQLLAAARAEWPDVGRLLITGKSDIQDLIAAVNLGEVQHYLAKPWNPDTLLTTVEGMAEKDRLRRENRRLRQVEAALRASEVRYRSLVERLPAGLLVHGADGRVTLSNPKASSLLGLAPEVMLGRPAADPAWQFLREDASPMPVEEYPAQRALASGELVSNQLVGIRRQSTGDIVWMLAHAYPTFDAERRLAQILVMFVDISRRKQADAALHASEARYRELFRLAQRQAQERDLLDQVRTMAASELELKSVIRKVVETIAETFGWPLVSLYLRQGEVMRLQHQVGYETVITEIPVSQGVIGKVIRSGGPLLLRDVAADPDFLGAIPGITSEACVPLFDDGRSVGVLNIETKGLELTTADLSLLEALAAEIGLALGRARLYTQVREDAATKAILLHEVNHRVKNNLSAIIGLLQLQQDYLPPGLPAAARPPFEDLIGRVRSLAAVHDLLSAAAWAPLPIHELISRIIQAAISIASPPPDVAVDFPPSAIQVTAKMAGPLALIINELATNSLKYALPKTPALRLSVAVRQRGGQIELEYRDNGPGFPPPVLRGEQHSVGLRLMTLLSHHDLRGKMELGNEGGAVVRLRFGAAGREALTPAPTGPLSISGLSS